MARSSRSRGSGRQRLSRTEWADVLDAWRKSGLSDEEFCRRRSLRLARFRWWRKRLGSGIAKSPSSRLTGPRGGSFISCEVPGPQRDIPYGADGTGPSAVEVLLCGGERRARFSSDCSQALVLAVVELLREESCS